MKRIFILVLTLILIFPQFAYAGDGATVILKSGTILRITNGFKQIAAGLKSLNSQGGAMNYPIEINIEGTSMFINLGDVAVVCRDQCNSIRIETPKKEK